MNDKELSTILNILLHTIESKKYELGIVDDKIKVRMGRHLATQIIRSLNSCITFTCDTDSANAIFGYPLEIEYNDPMCLEVHIVEKVPIYKEGEIKL